MIVIRTEQAASRHLLVLCRTPLCIVPPIMTTTMSNYYETHIGSRHVKRFATMDLALEQRQEWNRQWLANVFLRGVSNSIATNDVLSIMVQVEGTLKPLFKKRKKSGNKTHDKWEQLTLSEFDTRFRSKRLFTTCKVLDDPDKKRTFNAVVLHAALIVTGKLEGDVEASREIMLNAIPFCNDIVAEVRSIDLETDVSTEPIEWKEQDGLSLDGAEHKPTPASRKRSKRRMRH